MKKIVKSLFVLLLVISCTTMQLNVNREDAYKLNAKYIKQIYNLKVDNSKVGFYIKNNGYEIFSLIGNTIYHLTLDKDGKLIDRESYSAYDPN